MFIEVIITIEEAGNENNNNQNCDRNIVIIKMISMTTSIANDNDTYTNLLLNYSCLITTLSNFTDQK